MVFTYSLIHLAFVLGMLIVWRIWDRKYDYPNYIPITLIVGWLGTFVFDFAGVFIFRFWGYYSTNVVEYLFIAACTYVIATPLFIESINFLSFTLGKFRLPFKIKLAKRVAGQLALVSSAVVLVMTGLFYAGHIKPTWGFFLVIFVATVVAMDMIVYAVRGIKGPVSGVLDGQVLASLSIILSGLFCGFLWELLNRYFPLWFHQNLPPQDILGVPAVVVLFWGMLNMGYWFGVSMVFGAEYE